MKIAAIDWYRFLDRPRLPSPPSGSLEQLRDTSILVTGAGGSIGSALSLQLAKLCPRQLVLLDASEQALYRLRSALADLPSFGNPRVVLANITDTAHLDEIFETHLPQLVFHAAAYKHVQLLEEYPLEAIANNTLATLALAECAKRFDVKRVVLLSTDKAVEPISILGATKRIAEQITLAIDGVVLRLGNVLGSEGSVSEAFLHQITVSAPVTITDPNAERYFLTCEEAVDLLFASATAVPAGSMLVPELDRQHTIASLAEFLISAYSPNAKPAVIFTGLRPGDKMREALWSSEERPRFAATHGYLELQQRASHNSTLPSALKHLEGALQKRDLPGAMELVLQLVPEYTPSTTVLEILHRSPHGAAQR